MSTLLGIDTCGRSLHLLICFSISCSSMYCIFFLFAIELLTLLEYNAVDKTSGNQTIIKPQKLVCCFFGFFPLRVGASSVWIAVGSSQCDWESILFYVGL